MLALCCSLVVDGLAKPMREREKCRERQWRQGERGATPVTLIWHARSNGKGSQHSGFSARNSLTLQHES